MPTVHLLAFARGPRLRTWCDSIIHEESRQSMTIDVLYATCESCLFNVESYELAVNAALNDAAR